MSFTPRAVATSMSPASPLKEYLQVYSVSKLRVIFANYTPNPAILRGTEVLIEQRARDMLNQMRPLLWKSPIGDLYPLGYPSVIARLLSLLPSTETFTAIVQVSDICTAPHIPDLTDEIRSDFRSYHELKESLHRLIEYGALHGKLFVSDAQKARALGMTAASFSRNMNNG